MTRIWIAADTVAALVVAWLVLWPVGWVDCDQPTPLLRICPQSSTVGISLRYSDSHVLALIALAAIAVAGIAAFVLGPRATRVRPVSTAPAPRQRSPGGR